MKPSLKIRTAWVAVAAVTIASPPPAVAQSAPPPVVVLGRIEPAGGGVIKIVYDLDAAASTWEVALEVSLDGGSTFDVQPKSISGAVGTVPAGRDRSITWDSGKDVELLQVDRVRARIVARPKVPPPPPPDKRAGEEDIPAVKRARGCRILCWTSLASALGAGAWFLAERSRAEREFDRYESATTIESAVAARASTESARTRRDAASIAALASAGVFSFVLVKDKPWRAAVAKPAGGRRVSYGIDAARARLAFVVSALF